MKSKDDEFQIGCHPAYIHVHDMLYTIKESGYSSSGALRKGNDGPRCSAEHAHRRRAEGGVSPNQTLFPIQHITEITFNGGVCNGSRKGNATVGRFSNASRSVIRHADELDEKYERGARARHEIENGTEGIVVSFSSEREMPIRHEHGPYSTAVIKFR